jgi:hypothetical protein
VQEDVAPDVVAGKVDGHAQHGASAAVTNRSMDIHILVPAAVADVHARIVMFTDAMEASSVLCRDMIFGRIFEFCHNYKQIPRKL